jgi:hypothetical protein
MIDLQVIYIRLKFINKIKYKILIKIQFLNFNYKNKLIKKFKLIFSLFFLFFYNSSTDTISLSFLFV